MSDIQDSGIRYLDGSDVESLCRDLPVVDLVRTTLVAYGQGDAGLAAEAALRWITPGGQSARSLILPAWADGAYGAKIINASLGNISNGLERASGLIILNDPETARPVCVLEGGRISALRTAGVTVAAVAALQDLTQIGSVAFLGAGRQAAVHLNLLAAECPALKRVSVFDIVAPRAHRFAALMNNDPECKAFVQPATTPRHAVMDAELIVAVTTTTEPYVEPDWLSPGAIFANVSLDDATEALLVNCDHLFVDDWDLICADDHRLLGKLARAGHVVGPGEVAAPGARAVDADLPTLVSGGYRRPVRSTDRIVINPLGMGVNDIALAATIHTMARNAGRGRLLPR